MPPKRLHEQFDNDTGEGTSNIKKKLRFMERRHNYRCNRSLVGKYKGKRSKASFDLWNLRSFQLMAKTRNKNGKSSYW